MKNAFRNPMKSRIFRCAALAVLILGVRGGGGYAQEITAWQQFPYTLGGGLEYGLNTRENFALGYGVTIDRMLFNPWTSLGLRGTMFSDFDSVTDSEFTLNLRLYVLKINNGGPFLQLGWGGAFYREDERQINAMIIDATGGYRFYFLKGFYAEPFIRWGYPFKASIGALAGHWFNF